ncbi:MAG: replication initiator protein A [Isosphaeraceae bacterium]
MEIIKERIDSQGTEDWVWNDSLLGKDEMNLAEFPITLLADRKGVSMITREVPVRDEYTGATVLRKVTVTGSEQFGLPSAQDNLILLGLLYLTKRANDFRERRIWFTRSELIRVLGLPDSGQSYGRVELSLKRWANVFVLYENAWWEKPRQTYSSKGFGIIDDYELNDGSVVQESGVLKSNIAWNEVFFQSLEAGFVRTIDLRLLLRLRHPTSQQMYRFLGKRFYHSPALTLDLRTFACEHVGLDRGYKDNGKLKEKLQPALEELEAIGFLEPAPREQRYAKVGPRQWTITLRRRADLPLIEDALEAELTLSGPKPTEQERGLIDRGVTAAVAAELVLSYSQERVQRKLEVFDWLVERKDKRVSKSPAGYLAESIRKDYAAPRGFESRADRERKQAELLEQRRKVEDARRDAAAAQQAKEEAEQAKIKRYWDRLTEGEQIRLQDEALQAPGFAFMARRSRTHKDPRISSHYLKLAVDSYILKRLEREPEA